MVVLRVLGNQQISFYDKSKSSRMGRNLNGDMRVYKLYFQVLWDYRIS